MRACKHVTNSVCRIENSPAAAAAAAAAHLFWLQLEASKTVPLEVKEGVKHVAGKRMVGQTWLFPTRRCQRDDSMQVQGLKQEPPKGLLWLL